MICGGCGNPDAYRIRVVDGRETCNAKNCGDLSSLRRDKKTGFMCNGQLLHKASARNLRRQGRTTYAGDSSDEVVGSDVKL